MDVVKKCPACNRKHRNKTTRQCLLGSRKNPGQLEKWCKRAMRVRDRGICQWCGAGPEYQHHWSHVIPRSRGGVRLKYDLANFKDLCARCHMKWHEHPIAAADWFQDRFPDRLEYLDARVVETRAMGTVTVGELLEILEALKTYVHEHETGLPVS